MRIKPRGAMAGAPRGREEEDGGSNKKQQNDNACQPRWNDQQKKENGKSEQWTRTLTQCALRRVSAEGHSSKRGSDTSARTVKNSRSFLAAAQNCVFCVFVCCLLFRINFFFMNDWILPFVKRVKDDCFFDEKEPSKRKTPVSKASQFVQKKKKAWCNKWNWDADNDR